MTAAAEGRKAIEAILAERARRLAQPAVAINIKPTVDVVAFGTGNDRFAVATAFVYRLERLERVTPLPGAARHFSGITNVHGQLVPLVDLGLLLGSRACESPAFAIVLGDARADIGLLAETLLDIRALPLDAFGARPAQQSIVHHIISDGTAVIDAAALLADPRLTHEENSR